MPVCQVLPVRSASRSQGQRTAELAGYLEQEIH
jgi:hypothetical protein